MANSRIGRRGAATLDETVSALRAAGFSVRFSGYDGAGSVVYDVVSPAMAGAQAPGRRARGDSRRPGSLLSVGSRRQAN